MRRILQRIQPALSWCSGWDSLHRRALEIVAVAADGIQEKEEHQQVDIEGEVRAFVLVVKIERGGEIEREDAPLDGDALQAKERDQNQHAVGAATNALHRTVHAGANGNER